MSDNCCISCCKSNWYSGLLTRFPYILIIGGIIIVAITGPIVIVFYGLPDFGDPTAGFETRGTVIKARSESQKHIDNAVTNGSLIRFPEPSSSRKKRSVSSYDPSCSSKLIDTTVHRSKVVVTSKTGANMWTVSALKDVCKLDEQYFWPFAKTIAGSDPCKEHPSHSIGYHVAALSNTTCPELTDQDLTDVLDLLKTCQPYMDAKNLTADCPCPDVPAECSTHGSVHKIFYFLSDEGFLESVSTVTPFLKYALIFLRYEGSDSDKETFYLKEIEGKQIETGGVQMYALNLNIRQDLFNVYVIGDLKYYVVAMALVILILLLYLRSVALMFATILNVGFSFIVAYFLYFVVFRFTFFPFMNLLAGLVLIAVGADDVFIMNDLWEQYKKEESNPDPKLALKSVAHKTLKHGVMSIMVTSLTTATAFLSNLVSSITSIKLFGIFACTCILANFFFMVTWIMACIVLTDKVWTSFYEKCCVGHMSCWEGFTAKLSYYTTWVFHEGIGFLVTKLWPIWVLLLLGLGTGAIVVTFVTPKLQLPSSKDFQFFPDDHPMEVYHLEVKRTLLFEQDSENKDTHFLNWNWGAKAEDNGVWHDEDDKGHLVYQSIDIYEPKNLKWLIDFCIDVKRQSWIKDRKECMMDKYLSFMQGPCELETFYKNFTFSPCCLKTDPTRDENKQCLKMIPEWNQAELFQTGLSPEYMDYPLFDTSNEVKIYRLISETTEAWSAVYMTTDEFYKKIENFTEHHKSGAPSGVHEFWYSAYGGFRFYDLQKALTDGTYIGIAISLSAAFVVMMLTSCNIILALYAIITITLTIVVTIATLVLMKWELNILESLTITLSVGLSIDFAIHYGVAYRLSAREKKPEENQNISDENKNCLLKDTKQRSFQVKTALKRVGPAVAVAALTTFVAGASLMPGRVLSYRQFGMFLMIVMAISWTYATFFFLGLLATIGPTGNWGELPYLFELCGICKPSNTRPSSPKVSPKVSASNHTLANGGYHNPSYEMDQGQQRTVIPPISNSVSSVKLPRYTKDPNNPDMFTGSNH